jgi:hypothetical protein
VPHRLYWELYEGQSPLAKRISPLLTAAEIRADNDDFGYLIRRLRRDWDEHAATCRDGYPLKIAAIDRFLAFTKAGMPITKDGNL